MSITATRVGVVVEPGERLPSVVTCWRCGVRFNHHRENVVRSAPCQDCRKTLRDEGDTTTWRARPTKKATP